MVQMVAITAFEVNYHVDNFLQSERGCQATFRCQQKCLKSKKNAIDFRRFSAMSSWNERREGGGKSQY